MPDSKTTGRIAYSKTLKDRAVEQVDAAVERTKTTKPETNLLAVAAVRRWMVKHGYSTGGSDNIEFMLTNLEGQMWDRVRAEAKECQP